MKILIVGGVAGGATAAARLRRLDETAEIIILERSGFVSYANCGLPYYVGSVIKKKEALTLQTPESFWNRFHIEVRVHNEVTQIHPDSKSVSVKNLDDGTEYEESYDTLILSPGAKAVRPNIPGIDSAKVMTLRTVEDTYRIREFIEAHKPQTAAVIGGGFIGLEAAENLIHEGIDTTLFEFANQVMLPFDYDMACEMHAYLRQKELKLRLGELVEGFSEENSQIFTNTKGHEPFPADLVILAIGVVPDTHLAEQIGMQLGLKKSIIVNEKMQTSVPDIYAVGDAVEVRNFVTGKPALIALAGPANKQARIAADNICGIESTFKGSQGSSVIKLFDMTAATTGINEKTAQALNITYDKAVTYSASHATYYPGATNMTVKTIFSPEDGRILGAQIVGYEGVDKRLDVIATAIHAGMSAADLQELDLAYAPPFSSAKDPVNMAGFTIENVRSGRVRQFHWHDIDSLCERDDITQLDVRSEAEYAKGHIAGTINIPVDELRDRIQELDRSKTLYVNCHSGLRSYIACRILSQNGFDCYNLSGGYRFFEIIAGEQEYDNTPTHPCGLKIER